MGGVILAEERYNVDISMNNGQDLKVTIEGSNPENARNEILKREWYEAQWDGSTFFIRTKDISYLKIHKNISF